MSTLSISDVVFYIQNYIPFIRLNNNFFDLEQNLINISIIKSKSYERKLKNLDIKFKQRWKKIKLQHFSPQEFIWLFLQISSFICF